MVNIISIFSFKGGVGKTTITVNVATTLASYGWRVLVVDGDPQANLTGFLTKLNKGEAGPGKNSEEIHRVLRAAANKIRSEDGPGLDDKSGRMVCT
jgi:cellulose biosynthesis protein BcsQ